MNEMIQHQSLTMFRFFTLHKTLANKANKYVNKDGFDIQVEQLPVIMIPYFKGAISQQEIADTCGRDKSSILRSIASLSAKELVVTAQDPFDKRKKMVQLTRQGKKVAETVVAELAKMDAMFFTCLSPEEKDTFNSLLQKCEKFIAGL